MNVLISDFDGTITSRDFFTLAREYVPPSAPDYFALYKAGRITHFEAMAGYFAHIPTDAASLDALVRATQPDPDFAAAAARLAEASWDLIIVSAGSSWYIDCVLKNAGVRATVRSNPGCIVEGRGLVLSKPPQDSPFYSEQIGIDKPAVVHDALKRYQTVAFAGDGPQDLAPALLVRPELRFARRFLAERLERRGEGFRPFERWSEVVDAVLTQ
jgi:2,3-diketo-5-methylthio-1-phosphopentane phosphatase